MTPQDLEILLNTATFREKPPEYAIRLLEETCTRTALDWKLRHLYLVQRAGKWQVTLSIDGFRLIGSRDPAYAGQEGPFWTLGPDHPWTDIPPERAPYASKVGIKMTNGTTTWGVAKFFDYKTGPMWDKFPSTMTAKCAEMLAWRKAFPGKLGGLYGVEEMQQADAASKRLTRDEEDRPVGGVWESALASASNLEQIKAIGAQISKDHQLSVDEMQRLHGLYTEAKKRYEV